MMPLLSRSESCERLIICTHDERNSRAAFHNGALLVRLSRHGWQTMPSGVASRIKACSAAAKTTPFCRLDAERGTIAVVGGRATTCTAGSAQKRMGRGGKNG